MRFDFGSSSVDVISFMIVRGTFKRSEQFAGSAQRPRYNLKSVSIVVETRRFNYGEKESFSSAKFGPKAKSFHFDSNFEIRNSEITFYLLLCAFSVYYYYNVIHATAELSSLSLFNYYFPRADVVSRWINGGWKYSQ